MAPKIAIVYVSYLHFSFDVFNGYERLVRAVWEPARDKVE
jgi:hypothetical protein